MIKLSFEHINRTPIEQALGRLSNMPLPSLKTAYTVAKIKGQVSKAIAERRTAYTKLITDLSDKDENGNMLRGPDGMPSIKPENQDKLAEASKKIVEGELVIDWRPIEFSEVASCHLTANEAEALAPLINGLEEAIEDGRAVPAEEKTAEA